MTRTLAPPAVVAGSRCTALRAALDPNGLWYRRYKNPPFASSAARQRGVSRGWGESGVLPSAFSVRDGFRVRNNG